MPADVDVDSLWAALQQDSLRPPRVGNLGTGSIFPSPKQQRHSQSAKTEQSSVELPALKLETTQQRLQAADSSEKLAVLKALKVSKNICMHQYKKSLTIEKMHCAGQW